VTKPFQVEEVLARIAHQLRITRLQQELLTKEAASSARTRSSSGGTRSSSRPASDRLRVLGALGVPAWNGPRREVSPRPEDRKRRLRRRVPGHERDDRTNRRREGPATAAGKREQRCARAVPPGGGRRLPAEPSERGLDTRLRSRPSGNRLPRHGALHGRTLGEEITVAGALPPARCLEILRPICGVLSEAHAAGLVHRDIKPDNVSSTRVGTARSSSSWTSESRSS